jgi:DNA-binding NtrC family response regulator
MAALDQISVREIDLLLTDIVMPPGKPHGLALARMARVHRPGFPVMFMTGYHDVVQKDSDFPGRVFQKPLDIDELLKAIDDVFVSSPSGSATV